MPALRHFSQNAMLGNQFGGMADAAASSSGSHAELIATDISGVADSLVVSVHAWLHLSQLCASIRRVNLDEGAR